MLAAARPDGLASSYARALERYLAERSEAALSEAYELARRALEQGSGLIDWVSIHDAAVATLDVAHRGPEAIAHAADFLRESLSPFEMTQRGYVETNRWLERLNIELRREIGEKQRLAEQLQESNQELEAFSYSVAHDLRAPLRHIASFTEIVMGEYADELGDEARRYLERVVNAAHKMSELIDGLLTLSLAVRGEPSRRPVDLTARARTVCANLRMTDPDRKITIKIAEAMMVDADPGLVDVVLQNLLGNAWKFTSKQAQSRIEVGAIPDKIPVVFYVRDDGAGFDQAYADKLFGVFQRLHSADAFPGTGIGLATVRRIVRRHKGRIWADGKVGGGATFYFTLDAERA
jgi:light-regulated signal transduction histidine kinase (bacteriophytochrome)